MAKPSGAYAAILTLLRERGASTSAELCRATGYTDKAVRDQLLRLRAEGRIGRHCHGSGPGHKAFWFLLAADDAA